MPTPLLIITADIPFGELIRQSLEGTGRFVVRVTRDRESVAAYLRDFTPALAFLDTSLSENELLKIGAILRQANPGIIFVVVSEAGWHSALEELFPRDYLAKPFYLPDLLEMMAKFFHSSTPAQAPARQEKASLKDELPWLSDVTRAAQHLTRLTLESSAQAALITRADKLWAYAGQLPQPAASELAETLSRYWDHQEENDLVRFVRLVSTNAEHMLYGTFLAQGMVLALVFDAETPFSTIRTQASQLVHSLSTSPSEESLDEEMVDEAMDPNAVADILSDIPTPNPPIDLPVDPVDEYSTNTPGSRQETNPVYTYKVPGLMNYSRVPVPQLRLKPMVDTDQRETSSTALEETTPSPTNTRRNKARIAVPVLEFNQEKNPEPVNEVARKIVLEPVSASFYNLDYACLLVPRFPHHHMTGDLLDRLGEWLGEICTAYGWRLEYIAVRPEYLQWIVNVPPASSPAHVMRIFRQLTSEKIFAEFPRFNRENPSGEFWAPGDLIMGGSQPPPAQLIKDFITQTRQRQGFTQLTNR